RFKMVASVILQPVCWLAEGYLVWRLGGPWLLGLFAALLAPGGFFAIAWRDRVRRVGRDTLGFLRLVLDQDLRRRLAGGRSMLLGDLEALTRLVPAPGLAGGGGPPAPRWRGGRRPSRGGGPGGRRSGAGIGRCG